FSLITLLAFLGIHQIISTPIIFPLLLHPQIDLALNTAAFMCIYSWMFYSAIIPFNALNIIISNCLRTNRIKVTLHLNKHFFLLSFLAACIYIELINLIF